MSRIQADVEDREDSPEVDLGDPSQVKERNKRVDARKARLHAQYKKIMETKDGREFMHHLIYDKCGVGKKQFTGNSGTFANVGQLEIGQQITLELKTLCFDQWAQMEREAMER